MPYIKKLVMQGFKSFVRKTEIPFDQGINVVLGPNGSGKSARWDTEVLLASGEKRPIGEIVEESLNKSSVHKKIDDGIITKENPLGIKVFSINPITMKIEESNVSAFIKRDGEPNLYTIKTRTGKEVTTTSCHPVMIYRNGKIVSEIVENLKEGDFIATPNKLYISSNHPLNINGISAEKSNSPEFARFLGYIVGDGCIIKNSRIDFVNADKEILEDYKNVSNFIGFKISMGNNKDTIAKNNYLYSRSFSNSLISFFKDNYKKEKKHIPNEILFGDIKLLSNFLAALFDCDASVRKDNPTFEYSTMSKELADNVILGLLRFGITGRNVKKVKYASNTKERKKKEYFFITIEGKEKLAKLYQNIPIICAHKKERIRNWAERDIVINNNIDLLPQEVNFEIKKIFQLSGIKIKPIRKSYPLLASYVENRCSPSKNGLKRIIPLIEKKLIVLEENYLKISLNQSNLIDCLSKLNISPQRASIQIGLNKCIIKRDWASERFNARPENLTKLHQLVESAFLMRIEEIKNSLSILKNILNSDIFWDRINKIEKVKGEEYVYDLEVEDNHNFIANNIFVHNSNVSDALCFALGRMSAKSMRAAKTGNLIFMGSKVAGPAKEASVEMVFDNSDGVFALDTKEVSIKRIVRKNGLSIYKINNETKTRQDILSLLAQAGVDPNGFNIILQGEIQNFVRMHTEERRKVIEEVSGISIYEMRKERSLKELEKTEEKLKEVSAILRERTSYLNNLEKERQQALRFKKLQEDVKRFKASILYHDLQKKKKQSDNVKSEIDLRNKQIEKVKKEILTLQTQIQGFEAKIQEINSTIQKSTGLEQEQLNQEIANLRAELAGLNVKSENFDNKLLSLNKQKTELENSTREMDLSINDLQGETPSIAKKEKELQQKKSELERLEEQRKKFYTVRTEIKSLRERMQDKKNLFQNYSHESEYLIKQIESLNSELFDKHSSQDILNNLKMDLAHKREQLDSLNIRERELEKVAHTNEFEIDKQNKLIEKISRMDICPICKSKITENHISDIRHDVLPDIERLKKEIEDSDKELNEIYKKREILKKDIEQINNEIQKRTSDLVKVGSINDKTSQIKFLQEKIEAVKKEGLELDKKIKSLESDFNDDSDIEHKYETKKLEVQEISLRSEENVNSEISFKRRELDRSKIQLKKIDRELVDIKEELAEINSQIDSKEELLNKKRKQEELLSQKFKELISERDSQQSLIRSTETQMIQKQNVVHNIEQDINNFRIEKARYDAEIENIEIEILEYPNVEIIKAPKESLIERLAKTQENLNSVGSVNLRSLEVYDEIKAEYDSIQIKVETISKEKEEILKIIQEIDIKKKKTFLKTLDEINEKFSRNFSQISTKGEVSLELENRKDPFEGGVSIQVKMGHGKYFDVTSLSGGEQTMVALSLIFAIQEIKPYFFYILDEIDAALDKRNSERLASLLKKYMQRGQYIVITHNDEIISNATNLYGVSMHDGVSKVVSLKI